MKQTERIEQYMKDFGGITRMDAMKDLGILNLPARIKDMRESGKLIRSEKIKVKNRYGDVVEFVRYKLEAEG